MLVKYSIELRPAARRSLKKLEETVRQRVADAISELALEPRPDGVKKLQGAEDIYRIRVGSYRILYQIIDRELIILVVDVGHRGEIYR